MFLPASLKASLFMTRVRLFENQLESSSVNPQPAFGPPSESFLTLHTKCFYSLRMEAVQLQRSQLSFMGCWLIGTFW